MRRWLQGWLRAAYQSLIPPPDLRQENHDLRASINAIHLLQPRERDNFDIFRESARELIEARVMAGSGPMAGTPSQTLVSEGRAVMGRVEERALGIRESITSATGAFGDIELALSNLEWRREINLSWLEFSRWGIQQIMLISRLYYIKNPLIRRAIDVVATYVFGRGVEVTSSDADANATLKEFFERNKRSFGQNALVEQQKRKCYDGNLYWAFFADQDDTGQTDVRMIDATEINEIFSNPDDSDDPWFYQRIFVNKDYDPKRDSVDKKTVTVWYPALRHNPTQQDAVLADLPIIWGTRIKHRKVGSVSNWKFGCPLAYPALDWAKASRKFLESCAIVKQALAQIAMTFTTKGGQAAIAGAKSQLESTVNVGGNLLDRNPAAVAGSIFASGPGTSLEAFNTKGAGGDPSEVKEYRNMVAICFNIPPTWLGDLETANLSTATTLDRPTELGFICKQEEWVEDLTDIAKFVLETSAAAPSGKLREAWGERKVRIVECGRRLLADGSFAYEAKKPARDEIQVRVNFPAIREGDLPEVVLAICNAMTLQNKGGQVIGIDEKVGVRLLLETFGVEDPEEILEAMYPTKDSGDKNDLAKFKPAYDPCRTLADLPAPIGKEIPTPGGQPQNPGGNQPVTDSAAVVSPAPGAKQSEAARRLIEAIARLGK